MRLVDIIKNELVVTVEYLSMAIFMLPRHRIFNWLKSTYLKLLFGAKTGKRVVYYPNTWIFTGRNLEIGDDVDLAKGVLITTDGGVSIGDRVLIGYDTKILSRNHSVPLGTERIFDAGHTGSRIRIDNDVWIGANCVILPGVKIGEGAVVAAGSIVTKDVDPFVCVAGVPAKQIKSRLEHKQ